MYKPKKSRKRIDFERIHICEISINIIYSSSESLYTQGVLPARTSLINSMIRVLILISSISISTFGCDLSLFVSRNMPLMQIGYNDTSAKENFCRLCLPAILTKKRINLAEEYRRPPLYDSTNWEKIRGEEEELVKNERIKSC